VGRTAGDESQLWRKFEKKDKKCKLILMTVRVYITSLNSHFWLELDLVQDVEDGQHGGVEGFSRLRSIWSGFKVRALGANRLSPFL
jgi:hypothetical protein